VSARSPKGTKVTTGDPGEAGRPSRMTRQKRAVAFLLAETDEFTSAQDLHARLRETGEKVGLATVYSQLRTLADAGEIDSVRGDTGETLYRRCDLVSHHHHLVCRRCGHAVELDAPEVETWARRVGGRHGFRHLDHVLEITGVCDRCAEGT
jgi:Fur family transcriptional regulator, ferric uptake regulator